MRVTQRMLRGAAAAGIAASTAACIIPPAGVAPRPEEEALPAPQVSFYSFDQGAFGAGSGILTYSVTRDSYTAAFEVDQRGTVRVLSPSEPNREGRIVQGKSYIVFPQLRTPDREFLSPAVDFSRVPYVFVLSSDTPLDLSMFGTGRNWTDTVTVRGYDPDSTIAAIARRVLPDAPAYGSEFAYVAPRLRAAERTFAEECARPADDVHDYDYYRDMWAVFTPADQRLSPNTAWMFTPTLSWSSYGLLPLAAYRAEFAFAAFYPSCAESPASSFASAYSPYPGSALWGGLYYVDPFLGYRRFGLTGRGGYAGFPTTGPGAPIRTAEQLIPAFRMPRTPLGLATTQVAGNTSSPTPDAASDGKARVHAPGTPGQLGFRPFYVGRAPGEHRPPPQDVTAQSRFPALLRPIERGGVERQDWARGRNGDVDGGRAYGTRSMPELRPHDMRPNESRPSWNGGGFSGQGGSHGQNAVTRAPSTYDPPAAATPHWTPAPTPVTSNAAQAIEARAAVKAEGSKP